MTVSQPPAPYRGAEPSTAFGVPAAGTAALSSSAVAERRAWVVLWAAFALFLVVGTAAVLGTARVLATAHIDLPATVVGSNGLVLVDTPDGVESRLADSQVSVGSTLAPTAGAGVTLRLFEGSTISVSSQARVQLQRLNVGRFNRTQTVQLSQSAGPVRYQTAGAATVQVPGGTVHLEGGDDVTVWVQQDRTQVLVYTGTATVDAPGQRAVRADANQRAEVATGQPPVGGLPRAQELIANGTFQDGAASWRPVDLQVGPTDVDGQRSFVPGPQIDGTTFPALRISRQSINQAHGETGLVQTLNRDVSGFRHLILSAWVRVDDANLSGGGQLGSEYPVMLRVRYEGPLPGSHPDWVQGFYYTNPDQRPIVNGEQIPRGTWVHYQVDLMDAAAERRPAVLTDLEVMGQGHSYDGRIADVTLQGS